MPVKLGTIPPMSNTEAFEPQAFEYSDIWDIECTTGPDRLVIAPSRGHCEVLLELSGELPEPFGLLYVLLLSRLGTAEPGRCQSPSPVDRRTLRQFVEEFAPYLEGDGRHHFWVTSLPDHSTLVYDQHNVIYAYGPLDRYQRVIESRGLVRKPVAFPVPHTHSYNAEMDSEEARLLDWWDWRRFPLVEGDDL